MEEEDLAIEVGQEAIKTGRAPREILEAMRDEGYLDADDEGMDLLVAQSMAYQKKFGPLT